MSEGSNIELQPKSPPPAPTCPACGQPTSPNAVICMNCGYNRATGKQMGVNVDGDEGATKRERRVILSLFGIEFTAMKLAVVLIIAGVVIGTFVVLFAPGPTVRIENVRQVAVQTIEGNMKLSPMKSPIAAVHIPLSDAKFIVGSGGGEELRAICESDKGKWVMLDVSFSLKQLGYRNLADGVNARLVSKHIKLKAGGNEQPALFVIRSYDKPVDFQYVTTALGGIEEMPTVEPGIRKNENGLHFNVTDQGGLFRVEWLDDTFGGRTADVVEKPREFFEFERWELGLLFKHPGKGTGPWELLVDGEVVATVPEP